MKIIGAMNKEKFALLLSGEEMTRLSGALFKVIQKFGYECAEWDLICDLQLEIQHELERTE